MKVLITGGNGFVGLNIVSALVEQGHEVTALVRPKSNRNFLKQFPVKALNGDLRDKKKLTRIFSGVDAVIHTAGITSCNPDDLPQLLETNAESTRNVCDACIDAKIKRLVFTSTTSTLGAANNKNVIADEQTKLNGFRAKNPYGISKQLAERHVLDAADKGLSAVILNPAEVIGPFDYNLQWGRLVLAVAFNQLPFVPPGGASFCHASEVGRAHVNALTRGRSGEKYILGGVNANIKSYIEMIEKNLDANAYKPGGNYWVKYASAWMSEKFPTIARSKPAVEAYRMRVFGGHYYFSSAKAVKELDYREISLEQMVGDAVHWYQSAGMIPAKTTLAN